MLISILLYVRKFTFVQQNPEMDSSKELLFGLWEIFDIL